MNPVGPIESHLPPKIKLVVKEIVIEKFAPRADYGMKYVSGLEVLITLLLRLVIDP